MAHFRDRYLSEPIREALKWSPSLSVVGMRQAGKSTLIKGLAGTYLTLDDDVTLSGLDRAEWSVLERGAIPIAIDESQKLPKLFDRIKLYVDQRKQMGRYILSGSVRFLSRSQIRESLTGRTVILELLPFLISETHERELRLDVLSTPREGAHDRWFAELERRAWLRPAQLETHLERGGLPGIGFRREETVRTQLFRAHLDTLLGRDILFLTQTRIRPDRLANLYRELCLAQGLPINDSELARKTGMTAPTARKMIDVFAALFLLRRHGKTVYAEDGGLAEHAIGGALLSRQQRLRAFLFRELTGRALYRFPGAVTLSEYRTRGGAEVPFVWTPKKGTTLAITIDAEDAPGDKSIRSLESFLNRRATGSTACGIAFHMGRDRFVARSGILCLPLSDLI